MKKIPSTIAMLAALAGSAEASPSYNIVNIGGEVQGLPSGYGADKIQVLPNGCVLTGYQIHLSWYPSTGPWNNANLLVMGFATSTQYVTTTGTQAYVTGPFIPAQNGNQSVTTTWINPGRATVSGSGQLNAGEFFGKNFKTDSLASHGTGPINEDLVLPAGSINIPIPPNGAIVFHWDYLGSDDRTNDEEANGVVFCDAH
jgi:hypothetical protein